VGVSYREYLKAQKTKAVRTSGVDVPRTATEERAAVRAQYFRKSHAGYYKMAAAQIRMLSDG